MKIIFFGITLFSMFTGALVGDDYSSLCEPSDYDKMIDRVLYKMGGVLEEKHKMKVIGDYAAAMDCVNVIGLAFQIKRPIDQDAARKLIVDCVEEFLKEVNQDQEIRPYLRNFPFTSNNIRIQIYNFESVGELYSHPIIGYLIINDGVITYDTHEKGELLKCKSKIKESYEDALKIVQSQLTEDESKE